jgi:hypothetical protein
VFDVGFATRDAGSKAYFRFLLDERPKVKAANPTWNTGDIAKEVSARYNKLTAEEKDALKALAQSEFNEKVKNGTIKLDAAADAAAAKPKKAAAKPAKADDDDDDGDDDGDDGDDDEQDDDE